MIRIPDAVLQYLGEGEIAINHNGRSQDMVLFIQKDKTGKNGYLKVSHNQEILNEVKIYKALSSYNIVPEVIFFDKIDDAYYLYMSEVVGKVSYQCFEELGVEEVSRIYGESLRMLHGLEITSDIPRYLLNDRLYQAKENVELGRVDEADFQDENLGKSAKQLYEELLALTPNEEDLVVVHGDYCMPNVIIKDGCFSGFIDMGRGGVADRYQDIALGLRSLRYNLELISNEEKEKCEKAFLKGYGLDIVNEDKVSFYILLDEFF